MGGCGSMTKRHFLQNAIIEVEPKKKRTPVLKSLNNNDLFSKRKNLTKNDIEMEINLMNKENNLPLICK